MIHSYFRGVWIRGAWTPEVTGIHRDKHFIPVICRYTSGGFGSGGSYPPRSPGYTGISTGINFIPVRGSPGRENYFSSPAPDDSGPRIPWKKPVTGIIPVTGAQVGGVADNHETKIKKAYPGDVHTNEGASDTHETKKTGHRNTVGQVAG